MPGPSHGLLVCVRVCVRVYSVSFDSVSVWCVYHVCDRRKPCDYVTLFSSTNYYYNYDFVWFT